MENKLNILWLSPNLNHYKARFLNRFCQISPVDITVLAGSELKQEGHQQLHDVFLFQQVNLPVTKKQFSFKAIVYKKIYNLIKKKQFDYVLMPCEKKHLLIILFLFFFKFIFHYRLISYNHPIQKMQYPLSLRSKMEAFIFYFFYDRIIFYTEQSKNWSIKNHLLKSKKAFFVNNTLDTQSIWQNYQFKINKDKNKTILFIGRLTKVKWLEQLYQYYACLKETHKNIQLIIIGDGPESHVVKRFLEKDGSVEWVGAVVEEKKISVYMEKSHVVFIPGHSGLSIVHAFCYGKPYITSGTYPKHPPEFFYIEDGKNGLILKENFLINIERIEQLLYSDKIYCRYCQKAFETAQKLRIENWCDNFYQALTD